MSIVGRIIDALFGRHLRAIDAEVQAEYGGTSPDERSESTGGGGPTGSARGAGVNPRGIDWRVAVVVLTTCVSLTLQEYIGQRSYYEKLFPPDPVTRDAYPMAG